MSLRTRIAALLLGLLAAGCASDKFQSAVERGDTAAVKAMLEKDRSLVKSVRYGDEGAVVSRPLYAAIEASNVEMATALLDAGADVNGRALEGRTALHAAMGKKKTEMVDLLLARGARMDAVDHEGNTPLHHTAAYPGWWVEPAQRLLARGAPLSITNSAGDTPLHVAAVWGAIELAAQLCGAGADPTLPNASAQLPHVVAGRQDAKQRAAIAAWMDPAAGECTRLARIAAKGAPATEEQRRASIASFECAQMQQEHADPSRPTRRPNQARWCGVLAYALEHGKGIDKDENRAGVTYRVSCDNGDFDSCARFGVMLEEGRGVRHDAVRAVAYLQTACTGGDLWGCTRLGSILEEGQPGVPRDTKTAASLYDRSCKVDSGWSCRHLARLYEKGDGVPRDARRAAELHARACGMGEQQSCAGAKTARR